MELKISILQDTFFPAYFPGNISGYLQGFPGTKMPGIYRENKCYREFTGKSQHIIKSVYLFSPGTSHSYVETFANLQINLSVPILEIRSKMMDKENFIALLPFHLS